MYRNSCETCRKYKKKCDGATPVCGVCRMKGTACQYLPKRPAGRPKKARVEKKESEVVYRKSCEECRRRRVRCDGQRPACSGCDSKGLICVYQPRKMAKRKREQVSELKPQVQQVSTAKNCSLNAVQTVLDVLPRTPDLLPENEEDDMIRLFLEQTHSRNLVISTECLFHPTTLTHLLLRSTVVALAAKLTHNPSLMQAYEQRMRDIAGKLFDVFTVENGFAIFIVAYYYWYRNLALCNHYARIALSILEESKSESEDVHLMALMILFFCSNSMTRPLLSSVPTGILAAQNQETDIKSPLAFHRLLLVARHRLCIAFQNLWDNKKSKDPLELRIPEDEIAQLLVLLDKAEEAVEVFSTYHHSTTLWGFPVLQALRGIVYTAGHRYGPAASLAQSAMELLWQRRSRLQCHGFPFMVDTLNFILSISRHQKMPGVLSKAIQFRTSLVSYFPQADLELLYVQDLQSPRPAPSSDQGVESLPLVEIFQPDLYQSAVDEENNLAPMAFDEDLFGDPQTSSYIFGPIDTIETHGSSFLYNSNPLLRAPSSGSISMG